MANDIYIEQNIKTIDIQNSCGVIRYSIMYSDTTIVRAIIATLYPELVVIEDLDGNQHQIDNKTLFNIPDQYDNYHTYSLIVIGHNYDTNSRICHNIIFAETYIDYECGLINYNDNCENYTYLVKLESKHYQDITVYANENNYDFLQNCCRTCKFSKVNNCKLVCTKINIASKIPTKYITINPNLNPIIDPSGICNWYEEDLNKCTYQYQSPNYNNCNISYNCPPHPCPPPMHPNKCIIEKINDLSEDVIEIKNEHNECGQIIDITDISSINN